MEVFARAKRRISQGLSICIFPEGRVPDDESIILDEFKDGAFRLALEHQLPIVPLVFADNKERFSYTFLSGSPGIMRVQILPFIETFAKTVNDRKAIKQQAKDIIYNQLMVFNTK